LTSPTLAGYFSLIDSGIHMNITSGAIDPAGRALYYGTYGLPDYNNDPAYVTKFRLGALTRLSRFTLPESAEIQSVHFYSHAAEGHVRLGLYREDSPESRVLVWESASTTNTATNDYLTIPIASGTPSSLWLSGGAYHFAWQTDTTAKVASYSRTITGKGSSIVHSYGAFPYILSMDNPATRWFQSDYDDWTIYLQYEARTGSDTKWLRVSGDQADILPSKLINIE
jgi:hypothetical protein